MKRVAFYTLGCKVNQVETEQLKEDFLSRGYDIVEFDDQAEVYIINTCTVTHVSDRKSRTVIRRAARNNPGALVVVIGCLAQVSADKLAAIEGINLIVGNKDKDKLVDLIEDYETINSPRIIAAAITPHDKLKPVIYTRLHKRTRAFVKIQDGCQSFCSYCIVPYARGPIRSKLPEDVFREIKQLLDLGYKEIVLTGIHTGFYGRDLGKWNLTRLLDGIFEQIPGDYRIRLSSIEPLEVSRELIDMFEEQERLCRHLHIPLQSGSNNVLEAMNRRYTREYYRDLVLETAARIPFMAFTADVMVGFPLEEQEDFQYTYELLEQLPIQDLHVFKYSKRPGTKAAALASRVSTQEKQLRSIELIKLADKKRADFIDKLIGKNLKLLVERKLAENLYSGLSDNYIEVEFSSQMNLIGKFTQVKLMGRTNHTGNGRLAF